jgi:hypothetical protein
MKTYIKFLLVTLCFVHSVAKAGWNDIVWQSHENGWETLNLKYAIDAGGGWKFLPEAGVWIYVFDTPYAATARGWHLASYSFTDASYTNKETVLAGTSSVLVDNLSFEGGRGDLTITLTRHDKASGDLIASISYRCIWSDPPRLIAEGSRPSLDYSLQRIGSSGGWTSIPQNAVSWNQGWGAYFIDSAGTKFFSADMATRLVLDQEVSAGPSNTPRTVQVTLGSSFSATYTYEWKD